jgi:acetate CoA/acetoacetate CoA-transferase alpha subunit
MIKPVVNFKEAAALIPDGASIMVGGFMGCGNPHKLIRELVNLGTKNLVIYANDAAMPDYGIGQLVVAGQVKKLFATHIGLNPVAGQKMNEGSMEVTLIPQGTFAEQIRAGGSGLGGILTPTGVGTIVAEGKQVITLNEKDYLLELPHRADIAIISGYKVDRAGNIWYKGTTRSFSEVMATACDLVIVEAENLVECGEIPNEDIVTPGIFVDYIAWEGEDK